jgi:hypothetical protein
VHATAVAAVKARLDVRLDFDCALLVSSLNLISNVVYDIAQTATALRRLHTAAHAACVRASLDIGFDFQGILLMVCSVSFAALQVSDKVECPQCLSSMHTAT